MTNVRNNLCDVSNPPSSPIKFKQRWLSDGFVNVKALQKPVSNFIKIFNMYGKVIGGSISVDCFHEVTENGIYFLTEGHLNEPLPSHVDHVYTSPYNARLLQIKFKVNPENIVSLPINEKLLIQDNIKKLNFNVTLIDAKQKPGAVMFLFEGDDIGSVIYAGNCCYGWTGFNRPFQSFLKAKKLDYLYVYPPCPDCELHTMSVSELVDNLVNIIRWNPNCKFLIHDPCCREDILTDLKNRVKKPICVSENLMKHLEEVGQGADFDLDHNKSQIIVTDKLDYKMTLNEQEPLFKIILIPCSMKRFSQEIQVKAKDYHLMLYRNHCSPSELVSLVRDIDARHTVLIRPSPATSNLRHRPKGLAFWSHLGDFHRVLQFFDSIVEETHHKAELQNAGESQLTDKEDYTIEADKTDVTNCSDRSKTPPSISIIMIDSDIELNEPSK